MAERPPETLDDEWVRRTTTAISRGDRAALAAFYEAWFDRCYSLAGALTRRDESFCLDIVQDSMLRVIRSIKPLSTRVQLDAWMNRTVHSVAIDSLRRESRRARRHANRAVRESIVADVDDRLAWLIAELASLPAGDASLVSLRVVHEQTLRSIGAATGESQGAAHGKIRRALNKLRAIARRSEL